MVIAWSHDSPAELDAPSASRSAWEQVKWKQHHGRMPCLLVPQPAHAVLAGDLAKKLLPEAFGELPDEILKTIRMHDAGWSLSDAQQIHELRTEPKGGVRQPIRPVSFLAVPAAEATEAWTASIDSVAALSKAGAMVVSRHFCLLAMPGEIEHRRFLEKEGARQKKFERTATAEDFERWTAALGFCDLLSLYLLTGLDGEVDLPLARPSSPLAKAARSVTLRLERGRVRCTPAIFAAGEIAIQALRHPLATQGPRAETLRWEIA